LENPYKDAFLTRATHRTFSRSACMKISYRFLPQSDSKRNFRKSFSRLVPKMVMRKPPLRQYTLLKT